MVTVEGSTGHAARIHRPLGHCEFVADDEGSSAPLLPMSLIIPTMGNSRDAHEDERHRHRRHHTHRWSSWFQAHLSRDDQQLRCPQHDQATKAPWTSSRHHTEDLDELRPRLCLLQQIEHVQVRKAASRGRDRRFVVNVYLRRRWQQPWRPHDEPRDPDYQLQHSQGSFLALAEAVLLASDGKNHCGTCPYCLERVQFLRHLACPDPEAANDMDTSIASAHHRWHWHHHRRRSANATHFLTELLRLAIDACGLFGGCPTCEGCANTLLSLGTFLRRQFVETLGMP